MQEFNSISQNRQNIFFIVLRQKADCVSDRPFCLSRVVYPGAALGNPLLPDAYASGFYIANVPFFRFFFQVFPVNHKFLGSSLTISQDSC